jgi:hypothetical protein
MEIDREHFSDDDSPMVRLETVLQCTFFLRSFRCLVVKKGPIMEKQLPKAEIIK